MKRRWGWTPVTVFFTISFISGVIGILIEPSWRALAGLVLVAFFFYNVVGGCARRGEPLARRILPGTLRDYTPPRG